MTISNSAGQSATPTEKLNTLVVKNTTSPDEKSNGSMNYVLITTVSEILDMNIIKNLRIGYGNEKSSKRKKPIHKEIEDSFVDEPTRFIQRHTGFAVLCDSIKLGSPGDYGKNAVTLEKASLINGAQTQQVLSDILKDYDLGDTNYYKKRNIRVEVIVEKNIEEQHIISVARNSTINVEDVSRFGGMGVFNDLNTSMTKHNSDWVVGMSETSTDLAPQTILQVTRLFVSDELQDRYEHQKNIVKSYRNKAIVLKDFADMWDKQKEEKKSDPNYELDIYNFNIEFAPIAWEEYLTWINDDIWIKYWKKSKSENSRRLGRFSKSENTFTLSWAVICPTLYGLKDFVQEDSNGWAIKYPKSFDKEKYVSKVFDLFKNKYDYVPQDFAKNEATYLDLLRFAGRM